jgi:hypothetical protein
MIDIGHVEKVLEGETHDVGYIKGLKNLIELLIIIRDE